MAYIMTRKTEAAYWRVLIFMYEVVPGIQASNIVTDYEIALGNALRQTFPAANQQKCWFHMAQVIILSLIIMIIGHHILKSIHCS